MLFKGKYRPKYVAFACHPVTDYSPSKQWIRHFLCRQNALLATISEKDTNIAILEQNPTIPGEQEARKLKEEKDHLVDQLKQLVKIFILFYVCINQ